MSKENKPSDKPQNGNDFIADVSITEGKLPLWTNNDVDAAYLMGCINVGGMDALQGELNRLKELGLNPHQAVGKVRGKSGN